MSARVGARLARWVCLAAAIGVAIPASAGEPTADTTRPWLPTRPPRGGDPTEAQKAAAQKAYGLADRAFRRGQHAQALRHADAAFEALPNASTALVRATILAAMGDDEGALRAYMVALDYEPTEGERTLIEAGVAKHGAAVGRGLWTIAPAPDEAVVRMGALTWQGRRTVALPAGRASAIVGLDGYLAQDVVADVIVGAIARSAPRLQPAPVVRLPPTDDPNPDRIVAVAPRAVASPTGPVVTLASGGALVAAAVVCGVAAGVEADEAARLSAPGADGLDDDTRRERYRSARDRAEGLETAALITGVVGAAGVATGLVWLLTWDDGDEAGGVSVAPAFGASHAGLSVTGSF